MLRLSIRVIVELALTLVLTFIGLGMLLGTIDEYRSGKAFNKAMDNYAARSMEDVHDWLHKAVAAKPGYTAPQELLGKLLIDEGATDPQRYAEARKLFEELRQTQEARGGQASLPVLMGLAVAELESARARKPGSEELKRALTRARVSLDKARDVYPRSGDLHVNLATVALLANDVPLCRRHLAKVQEFGNISIDALPFLYNLSGLAALHEGSPQKAVAEFAKVKEFAPDWQVPSLNLAAAYARGLMRGDLDEATASRYASFVNMALARAEKAKSELLPLLCHALAVHRLRSGNTSSALDLFRRAEKHGELSWHARFNRAMATYVCSRAPRLTDKRRATLMQDAQPTLERALRSKRATSRDRFLAAVALGTIYAEQGKPADAIAAFERAAGMEPGRKDTFMRQTMPRVHHSLAALHYAAGTYKKALVHLDQAKGFAKDKEKEKAQAILRTLRSQPTVSDFSANMGKIVTDYDVRISAVLATPATPEPVAKKDVRLSLVNATTHTTRELPFELLGSRLHALVLNLPQGRQTIELEVTDALGNRSRPATKTFAVDREPPRVASRVPEPGATVRQLKTIDFRVYDVLGSVDFSTLSIMLKYPRSARTTATRYLVSRGKYVYAAADGSVKKGSSAEENVRAPVPAGAPSGDYRVSVRVRDVQGRLSETEWSFTLR